MSADGEKKFVIKHVFNVSKMSDRSESCGNREKHFDVPWRLRIYKFPTDFYTFIQCVKFRGDNDWSIDTTINVKVLTNLGPETIARNRVFSRSTDTEECVIHGGKFGKYLVDGNLTIEYHVTINNMNGIREVGKKFDESNKKFSDVVLKVKDQKFYVNKMYLASHSTYFEALFMGNFEESKQSEVELKDIDPYGFQKFLEIIHAESTVDDDIVEEILHLADFFDAKSAIKRCKEFLVHRSEQDLKFKFRAAVKYNMDELKKKCISEMKTSADIESVLPEDNSQFNSDVWRELMDHTIALYKNEN